MPIEAPERTQIDRHSSRPVVAALESTRRSLRTFRRSMTITGLALGLMAGGVTIAVADVSWILPTWARTLALAALLLGSLVTLALASFRSKPGAAIVETATEIESAYPELGQRVRTTLEYLEPTAETMPALPSLVGALVADTDRRSQSLAFSVVVPWSKLRNRLFGLAASLAFVGIAIATDPDLAIAARRLFLAPVHYTRLAVEPGDQTMPVGSGFTLKATFAGRPVREARWLTRPAGSAEGWSSTPLGDPTRPVIGTVEASRPDCQANFEYRVVAGELKSDVYRVIVTRPLILKGFEAQVDPPTYTRLKPSTVKEADFKVPEGSKVQFAITLDRAPISGKIVWTPDGSKTPRTLPLIVEGNKLTGELPPVETDVAYQISATAAYSMKLEPLLHRIKVIADVKPTIKFLKPSETHAATATTEVPIQLQAGDDHGVAKVGIVYRVNDGPEQSLYLDAPGAQPTSVDVLTRLYLENHKLTIADSLSYQAFVEDNRPIPQRVTSEIRFIDILPYRQDYQLVNGGPPSSSKSVTLEELILRQRITLNRTLAHVNDHPVDPKVADRLSKDEAELTMATGEFATALASQFGVINPLDDAEKAMQAATAALDSKDFPNSLALERTALASLIKARQNLRKLMSNSATAGTCQKIDRQQRDQKIRKPPADPAREAEIAKLEPDLRKLAEQQKKFAEDIAPKPGGGAKLETKNEANASKPPASPAQQQTAASQEAGRLNALAKQDQRLSDLARSRMAEAAQAVETSEQAIEDQREKDSAAAARDAAEQLERVADQVAGLKADDLADKIARARDLARSTARVERELADQASSVAKDDSARQQRGLAEAAKTLAELLDKIREKATEEDRNLAQGLDKTAGQHPLEAIEKAMREAANDLKAGQPARSVRTMKDAAAELDALAGELESARREFAQPRLQQLLAAEKQAADALKALDSVTSESKKAEAEKALADLEKTVQSLKSGDGAIRQASETLANLSQGSLNNRWTPPQKTGPRPGLFTPPIAYTKGVGEVAKALQARIQEIIVNDALVDRDGPVPPGYRQKVEDYFRVLSEDLR